MRPTVLITGGSGLLALNWASTVRDLCSVVLGIHEHVIALERVQTRQIDLESVDHLVLAFESIRPQIVIHTAGITNVEKCEAEPYLAQHVNVDLAGNVAEACAKLGLQLVHISTDHLFSGKEEFAAETQPTAPINAYGRTKAEAERRVLEAYPPSLVIRTNFYGWGPRYRRSFSDVVIDALRSGKELTMFKDVFYTPILIETVTQATHELINLGVSGVFHVVGDERISKYEFALKVAGEFSLDSRLIKSGLISNSVSLVERPYDMSLSNEKTCRLLGRRLGGVDDHIAVLRKQEKNGLAREIHNL